VFEKLAKEISKLLNAQSSAEERQLPWHQDVVGRLSNVKTFEDLLDGLAALDGLTCAYTTSELSRYSPTVKIADQKDRSAAVLGRAGMLFEVYRRVLVAAVATVASPKSDLGAVAGRITIDEAAAKANKDVRDFLLGVRGFVLLSLWVASRSPVGAQLVTDLAQSNAAIMIRIFYKEEPASLLAFVAGPGAYAKSAPRTGEDIRGRTEPITNSSGAPSQLGAPVWLTEQSAGELEAASFKYQTADQALAKILTGSISFTRDRAPFYTPARIELLHELIHVLHNARGSNREKVMTLTEDEQRAFKDAEEYWTVAGGTISENAFNAVIGAPERWGHSGLMLTSLDPSSKEAGHSLRELAGF